MILFCLIVSSICPVRRSCLGFRWYSFREVPEDGVTLLATPWRNKLDMFISDSKMECDRRLFLPSTTPSSCCLTGADLYETSFGRPGNSYADHPTESSVRTIFPLTTILLKW